MLSIRLRITLWYTTLLGLVLTGFAVLVFLVINRQLTSQLDYTLHVRTVEASRSVYTRSLGRPAAREDRLDLPATAESTGRALYVQLVDPRGSVLATSSNLPEPLPTASASLRPALEGQASHTILTLPGGPLDLLSTPVLLDNQVVGVLQVAASLQPLEATLAHLRLVLAAIVFGTTALAALLGWLLAARALRPVAQVTQTAHAIGRSTNFAQRLPNLRPHDEVGRLAATFNEMLERLDQAIATQRRFLADASHELRGPLTTIRTNVEALLRGAAPDPAERDLTLRAIARETDRLGRLVVDLLTLARADVGQPMERRPLMLDTLLLEVYRQEKTLAGSVHLALGEFEQVEIAGDRDRLKQLLLNLVDNGLRYTPAGGSVTLDLVRQQGWAVVRVRDTGLGIAAAHLPRIFERFYRVDRPRTRDAGGTGLGLAICQSVAEAHGGRIEVVSQEGQGSVFTVFLPTRAAAAAPAEREPGWSLAAKTLTPF